MPVDEATPPTKQDGNRKRKVGSLFEAELPGEESAGEEQTPPESKKPQKGGPLGEAFGAS